MDNELPRPLPGTTCLPSAHPSLSDGVSLNHSCHAAATAWPSHDPTPSGDVRLDSGKRTKGQKRRQREKEVKKRKVSNIKLVLSLLGENNDKSARSCHDETLHCLRFLLLLMLWRLLLLRLSRCGQRVVPPTPTPKTRVGNSLLDAISPHLGLCHLTPSNCPSLRLSPQPHTAACPSSASAPPPTCINVNCSRCTHWAHLGLWLCVT